jgi:hypothetical protein
MWFYPDVIAQAAEQIVTKELHTHMGTSEGAEQLLTHFSAFFAYIFYAISVLCKQGCSPCFLYLVESSSWSRCSEYVAGLAAAFTFLCNYRHYRAANLYTS